MESDLNFVLRMLTTRRVPSHADATRLRRLVDSAVVDRLYRSLMR